MVTIIAVAVTVWLVCKAVDWAKKHPQDSFWWE